MEAFEFLFWWLPDVFSDIVAHDKPWWVQVLAMLGCLGVMPVIGGVVLWLVLR
jgi:hypothetical protein